MATINLYLYSTLKLIAIMSINVLSLAFMAGVLGILLDISYRVIIMCGFENLYDEMTTNFSRRYAYLQLIAVLFSFLFIPIIKRIADTSITQNFLSRKSRMVITFLFILMGIDLFTRYLIANLFKINTETRFRLTEFNWYFWITIVLISFVTTIAFKVFVKYLNSKLLNITSARLFKKVLDREVVDFSLFLRPFDTDNKLTYDKEESVANYYPFSSDLVMKEFSSNFEYELASLLKKKCPLIGLGKSNLNLSGRVEVDNNEWEKTFKLLAKSAKQIFLIPAVNQGTFFEITWIRKNEDLLAKTFFILPPRKNSIYDHNRWTKISKKCEEIKAYLPPYFEFGYYFQLDKNGKCINQTAISKLFVTSKFNMSFNFSIPSINNNNDESK